VLVGAPKSVESVEGIIGGFLVVAAGLAARESSRRVGLALVLALVSSFPLPPMLLLPPLDGVCVTEEATTVFAFLKVPVAIS